MAAFGSVTQRQRWLDTVIVRGSLSNIDGEQANTLALPADLGNVAIMDILLTVSQIDVVLANPELYGVSAFIMSAGGAIPVDFVGSARFQRTQTTANSIEVDAHIEPDHLIEWKEGELLYIFWPELDTDATPTADATVYVRVAKVPAKDRSTGPIQLVR